MTFGFPEEPVQRDLDSYMTVASDSHYQSTLDAVCVYVVPRSEFPVAASCLHVCSAVVGVPHRPLLPFLPQQTRSGVRTRSGVLDRSTAVPRQ